MSKRSRRRKRKQSDMQGSEEAKPEVPLRNEPWIKQRTGFIFMAVLSVALAVFTVWQTAPAIGIGEALLWGGGFGLAIWGVFFLAYAFNRYVRGL